MPGKRKLPRWHPTPAMKSRGGRRVLPQRNNRLAFLPCGSASLNLNGPQYSLCKVGSGHPGGDRKCPKFP